MKHKTEKKEESEGGKVRKEALKKIGLIFLGLLLVVNTIQLARFGGIVERVDLYNAGMVDELGGLRQDVMTFASDLNEIRGFLLLPVKEYSFTEKSTEEVGGEEKASSRTETALYSFVDQVTSQKSLEKNAQLASEIAQSVFKDKTFADTLATVGLLADKIEDSADAVSFKINEASGGALFSFVMEKKTGKGKVQSAGGVYEIKGVDVSAVKNELAQFVTSNKEGTIQLKNTINAQKEAVAAIAKNFEITKVMTDKKISMSSAEETDVSINYNFVNSAGEPILTVLLLKKDGSLMLNDQSYKSADQIQGNLISALQSADSSTSGEKLMAERRNELESIFKQEEFQDMIKNAGLTIAPPREEYNKVLYDVKSADGKTAFSYAIEISSGLYKVIKDDQELDLYSTLQDDGSKKNF
jgi:hypothetical protein